MTPYPLAGVLQQIYRLAGSPSDADIPDSQLLEGFARGDRRAVEILLRRHGPLVWRVCRRVLGNADGIEDAFQATFLVLAEKAGSIRKPGSLASWLHGVAYRMARRCRLDRRGAGFKADIASPGTADSGREAAWRELAAIIDEEVAALPEKLRGPILLCYWEGKTNEEAARTLGLPCGTVKSRLSRAREILQRRLTRRGVALPAGAIALVLAPGSAEAVPTAALMALLQALALNSEKIGLAAGGISGTVTALVQGTLRSMFLAKVKLIAGLTLILGILAGFGLVVQENKETGEGKNELRFEKSEKEPLHAEFIKRDERPGKKFKKPGLDLPGTNRMDRHGDLLPEGAVARLGTIRLRVHWGGIFGFSPDGKIIITVSQAPEVKFWDAETGQLQKRFEFPVPVSPGRVFCWLSGDCRLLAILEGPITIWDLSSGKTVNRFELPPKQWVFRAAFSHDGKLLAVAESGAQEVVRLWDVGSGKQSVLKSKTRTIQTLAFSPDGQFLAGSDGNHVACWKIPSGALAWQGRIGFDSFLGFTPDSRILIASPGHQERIWHSWEAATGKPALGLKFPGGYNFAEFAVAPGGRDLVFVQNKRVPEADGRVRLWDLQAGKLLRTLPVTWPQIGPFAPDGKSFLTNDGSLQRWDLSTGRPLLPDTEKFGHRLEIVRVVYSPNGRLLASAAKDGSVRLWDIKTSQPRQILRPPPGKPLHRLFGYQANDLAFTPDSKHLLLDWQSDLLLWDLEGGKIIRRISLINPKLGEKKQYVWKLHLTPEGQTATVISHEGGPIGTLSRWDLATSRRISKVDMGRCDGFLIAFSPDGRTLASGGELLDTSTGKSRAKLTEGPSPFGHYAFSPDGRLLAGNLMQRLFDGMRTGFKIVGIQVWNSFSGQKKRLIKTDSWGPLAFSPDGRFLAAPGPDGLRLFEWATGQVVMKYKAHERQHGFYARNSFASCLSFAPDGRTLATGHPDSTILIWNMLPPLPVLADRDLPRLWNELGGTDAARAYAASWQLAKVPDQTLRLLRKHMHPASPAPAKQVRALLADLDSRDFRKRRQAAAGLRELGDRAAGELKMALQANPSLETRRRMEDLLKKLEMPPSGELLRELRAVAVLEHIGTPEARNFLKTLAQGMPEGRITRESRESLERLNNRRASSE